MLRAQCLSLATPQDAVITDRHAAWLLGAEMVLAPNEHLEVLPVSMYLPTGRRLRNGLSLSGERQLRPEDITEVIGLPVTTKLRTAWDLGRVRSGERAISGLDQMLRLPGFPAEEFLAGVERFKRERWVTTLRALAPLADGRAESPPESILRLYWIDAGLPWPLPQLEVWVDGEARSLGSTSGTRGSGSPSSTTESSGTPPRAAKARPGSTRGVASEGFAVDVFKRTTSSATTETWKPASWRQPPGQPPAPGVPLISTPTRRY